MREFKGKEWVEHQVGVKVSEDGEVWWTSRKYPNGHFTYGSLNNNGYLVVNYQGKKYLVQRLVADCFIPNPDNKPQVDHINRNKQDNRVANLRWVTSSENNYNRGKYTIPNAWQPKNDGHSKIVLQYTKSGDFIREWPSTKEVERELGFNQGNISSCCNGRLKSAYKYLWKYKDFSPITEISL